MARSRLSFYLRAQELTKPAARYRDMSQELIVIVSIIAAATFAADNDMPPPGSQPGWR
jgi:hypothetical protein